MPRKSTICHRGDIFVAQKTMRCRRAKNALYGHPSVTPFFDFKFGNYIHGSAAGTLPYSDGFGGGWGMLNQAYSSHFLNKLKKRRMSLTAVSL